MMGLHCYNEVFCCNMQYNNELSVRVVGVKPPSTLSSPSKISHETHKNMHIR